MRKYIERLIYTVILLFLVSILIIALIRLLLGDPMAAVANAKPSIINVEVAST